MTVAYVYGNSLYLNITNRCSNSCTFCVRTQADGFYADDLWLKREPTRDEILEAVRKAEPEKYDSVVFCGYGEPTERLDDMLYVCRQIKKEFSLPIRLNTNGQSDLINCRRTAPDFAGAVDRISISLNAPDAREYARICRPVFGEKAFQAVLTFAADVKQFVPDTVFSVVKDTITDADIEKCRETAARLGVPIRVGDYIKT